MKEIIKCVWANKVALGGLFFCTSLIFPTLSLLLLAHFLGKDVDWGLLVAFFVLCILTIFFYFMIYLSTVSETLKWYRRTQEHIRSHGKVDRRYAALPKAYCAKVGFSLAVKESGINWYKE